MPVIKKNLPLDLKVTKWSSNSRIYAQVAIIASSNSFKMPTNAFTKNTKNHSRLL
jgi:hypothetical protein